MTEIDFDTDEYLTRWLHGRNESTVSSYKPAMKHYLNFTQMTPKQLIEEKLQDMTDASKKPWERESAENRVRDFNKWLIEKAVKRGGKVGYAPNTALSYCAMIADFYSRHNLPLTIKLTQEFAGAPKGENETEKMSAEQIEKLAYLAPTSRDKAIVWCMFQGGMDVSTAMSLNWGHVEKEILDPPLGAVMLKGLERKKEKGRRFITFIYKTAIEHLRRYLKEVHGEDYPKKLKYDTPLFLGREGSRHAASRVAELMRKIAPDSGIAGTRQDAGEMNPLRPHALRASFSDRMAKAGASQILIDYFQGHKIKFGPAYFGGLGGLRESYVRYAQIALEPRRIKPTTELADAVAKTGEVVTSLAMKVDKLEKENVKLSDRLADLEEIIKDFGIDKLSPEYFRKIFDRQEE